MRTIKLWAPFPKKVLLRAGPRDIPMKRKDGGWWETPVPPGASDYGFVLDGKGPFPDPRSPWQPNGVHGLSRFVDHAAFTWADAAFRAPPLSAAVIYEAHVGTFSPEGTFDGMISRLDHLVRLGVTHLEILPVNEFSGERGWGYDGVDWFAPHDAYGGPDGLKRLVNACHARGLAVILDVVYNHMGPVGNYLGLFGPYFTDAYRTVWGPAPNFDGPGSDEVRRFVCDNALMWLRDYHFDGLRIDAVHALFDRSAIPILAQLSQEVRRLEAQLGRSLTLIGESDLNDPRILWPVAHGGWGLDAQWSDDFHHSLHTVLTGEKQGYYADYGRVEQLAKALRHAYVYDGQFSAHRQRTHGRPAEGLSGQRFLGYIQNHDQIGNRAAGDRLSVTLSSGQLKTAAALVLMSPFVPMIFQGEEWAATTPFQYFTSHKDKNVAQAVRHGRRREFGWSGSNVPDPQARSTFLRSKLDWSEPARDPHATLLEWHRKLIALRRSHSALAEDRLDQTRVSYKETEKWLLVERGALAVAANFSPRPRSLPLSMKTKRRVILGSDSRIRASGSTLNLPPQSAAILEK